MAKRFICKEEKIANWRRRRLIEETSKLNPKEEQAVAEEGISAGNEVWDEYQIAKASLGKNWPDKDIVHRKIGQKDRYDRPGRIRGDN